MNKKEFTESLKGKTVEALLKVLKLWQTEKQKIDPEFLNQIIEELYSRELTEKEAQEFENIIKICADEPVKVNKEFSEEEIKQLMTDTEDKEPNKYKALKTYIGLISLLGYIVIFVGFCMFVSSVADNFLIGIISIVLAIVIALPLLAFSNLIQVFIDIEYNTREQLKKK